MSRDHFYEPKLRDRDAVSPTVIEGIEIHVGSLTPVQYQNQSAVILIRTRQ